MIIFIKVTRSTRNWMPKQSQNSPLWKAMSLAWELGYVIAIPIVVLAFGGAYADKYFKSSPIFLLTGVFLSILISTIGIIKKAKEILVETEREVEEEKRKHGK